jgi:ABC-type nickel/cobalt efflux system permease component RcnA
VSLTDVPGLVAGAVALGALHGVEPGHGWPVAATYALEQSNKWVSGLAASLILGVGHLISSLAVVGVFFLATDFFGVTQLGWLDYVAGGLLILLGVRELRGGGHHHESSEGHDSHEHGERDHSHGEGEHDHSDDGRASEHDHHEHDAHDRHDHSHTDHRHAHDADSEHDADDADSEHDADDTTLLARATSALPFGGHGHGHRHGSMDDAAERGLWGIASFAFLLGFAHEEEFEIIAICTGSSYCLELMLIYALTVVVGIVGLTLALVAGYHAFEERVERLSAYFPTISGVVLLGMGFGFLFGVF